MFHDPGRARRATEGMVDYDDNSGAQRQLVGHHTPRIRGLVDRLGRIDPELRIVDYGCGPGTSAIEAVRPAVEAYRANVPEGRIAVCHADQPGNDWNALFALATGPAGYHAGDAGVRTEAAIGSFYQQMVAPGSVALGTSFAASHWLSRAVRLHAPGTLWFADLVGDARVTLAAQARQDWITFLRCRAVELRPGGYLLVSKLGSVADPAERNGVAASGRGVYRALQHVAEAMAEDGLIDRPILDRFVFGLWFMTVDEAREPLAADPVLAEVFTIEELAIERGVARQADVFADAVADPVTYARLYVGFIRGFADSTLRTELLGPSAADEAATARLADEFYRRLDVLYRQDRDAYACELWPLTVVLRRT
ncbi:MAG: hypothetical protein AAFX81_02845 [Pseudomonadota bacterium]